MRYSLKQLAVFDAVATLGGVSAAADKLAMTQSAASMSIHQLEKLLGRELFERQGKKLVLSHWGRWLRPRARQLLFDAQQIEIGLYDQLLLSGEIALAASQTPAEHIVPQLVSNLDADFPEVRVHSGIGNTEEVIHWVRDYKYDLGIIEGRCDDDRLKQQFLAQDHLVIVSAAHHPYTQHKQVSMAQLAQAKWVLREQGAGTRNVFESAIYHYLERIDIHREYSQVSILKKLVANSLYLSCLPFVEVVNAVEQGELAVLNVPELDMSRTYLFIWRDNSSDNPLRDCVISEAKRMVKQQALRLSWLHGSG